MINFFFGFEKKNAFFKIEENKCSAHLLNDPKLIELLTFVQVHSTPISFVIFHCLGNYVKMIE